MNFLGLFETHITVSSSTNLSAFRAACGELGVKPIAIDLPSGSLQPMTGSFFRGSLDGAKTRSEALANALTAHGFDVIRTKIEQHGRLENAPVTDAEAQRVPASYFEYHAKLSLGTAEAAVSEAITSAGGHLSANAQNRETRFVTLRAFGLGRAHADARFGVLVEAIAKLGIPIRNRVREYCVFDSNPAVDRGWIEAP